MSLRLGCSTTGWVLMLLVLLLQLDEKLRLAPSVLSMRIFSKRTSNSPISEYATTIPSVVRGIWDLFRVMFLIRYRRTRGRWTCGMFAKRIIVVVQGFMLFP